MKDYVSQLAELPPSIPPSLLLALDARDQQSRLRQLHNDEGVEPRALRGFDTWGREAIKDDEGDEDGEYIDTDVAQFRPEVPVKDPYPPQPWPPQAHYRYPPPPDSIVEKQTTEENENGPQLSNKAAQTAEVRAANTTYLDSAGQA